MAGSFQTQGLTPARLGKFKGQIIAHAAATECLGREGRRVPMPRNNSDTYVARSWLPYGATASQPNQFFANGTGDRGNAMVQAHLTQEGVTPLPESITARDVTVVLQQYSCLYGFTDKMYDLYEDNIPKALIENTGERVTLVNEQIVYGTLKACTNAFYGGVGTSRSTVNGPLTLNLVRKIAKSILANNGKAVTKILKASADFATTAVEAGFFVYVHTDLEPDIRDLPGFRPTSAYASGEPRPMEIGMCERFRFIAYPNFPSLQDAGAAVGATGLYSTSGSNIDVYPIIVTGADAWSQIAVRGMDSVDPTYIPPGTKSASDPFGQRGYVGAIWWKAVMIENNGWMAVANVGVRNLS